MVAGALAINLASSVLNPLVFSFFLGPMSRELGVGVSALAWALTVRIVAGGVSGPLLGVVLDRYGPRWVGVAAGVVSGAALVAVAYVDGIWPVYALFAVTGLAGLGGGPGGQLLTQVPITKWFVVHRGRALAVATIGLAAGTLLAIPASQWLIGAIGWRATSVVYGVFLIAVVVPVSLLYMRRRPEDLGLLPDGATADAHAAREALRERDWSLAEALRTPVMWLVLGVLTVSGTVMTGALVHRVHFWEDLGMPAALIGLGTVMDPIMVIPSALLFGRAANRFPIRLFGLVGLGGFGLSMIPMIVSSGEAWTILVHNVVWGSSAGAFITFNNLVWPTFFGRASIGAIRGVVTPVFVIASGVGPPLYGYLFDVGLSANTIWWISLASFCVAGGLLRFARSPITKPAVVVVVA